MKALRKLLSGVGGLFYPRLCLSCGHNLPPGGLKVCVHCISQLHFTDHHLHIDNTFSTRLFGRVPFYAAGALLVFRKGGLAQPLLHELKYKGNSQIGIELGRWHGKRLKESDHFQDINWILPVPLHIKKKRIRGYNQSAKYAEGLSDTMEIPFSDSILIRNIFTETQTKKGKDERFHNVSNVFGVAKPRLVRNQHVLIVDDVMTTGATLESCANALLAVVDVRISFAVIAIARY